MADADTTAAAELGEETIVPHPVQSPVARPTGSDGTASSPAGPLPGIPDGADSFVAVSGRAGAIQE